MEEQEVVDFSELSRRMQVTQARISMLVALTFLAPDIQEELLLGGRGLQHLTIHHLLLVARMKSWADQRRLWAGMRKAQHS